MHRGGKPRPTLVSHGLGCFTAVQGTGIIHEPHITGGGAACVKSPHFLAVNTVFGNLKTAFASSFTRLIRAACVTKACPCAQFAWLSILVSQVRFGVVTARFWRYDGLGFHPVTTVSLDLNGCPLCISSLLASLEPNGYVQ